MACLALFAYSVPSNSIFDSRAMMLFLSLLFFVWLQTVYVFYVCFNSNEWRWDGMKLRYTDDICWLFGLLWIECQCCGYALVLVQPAKKLHCTERMSAGVQHLDMYLFHLMTDIYHFGIWVFDETDDQYYSWLKSFLTRMALHFGECPILDAVYYSQMNSFTCGNAISPFFTSAFNNTSPFSIATAIVLSLSISVSVSGRMLCLYLLIREWGKSVCTLENS